MKKFLAAAMMVVFAATAAMAADTVVLKAKNGDVTFNHKKHSADPASCKGCHETKKAGPTKCGECHKK